ncbi:MAG: R3H domain-containing nucleic acid-binding protein, partial [Myxococcota bacterium]
GGDSKSSPSAGPAAEPEESAKPSKGTADGTLGPAGDFILGAIERMGLGNFEIKESSEEDSNLLVYQVSGEVCEALGAGDGRAADALQLLANQAARLEEDDPPRVVIEVEGKSEERAGSLQKLAERAADRALESGRALALDAMNGRDRRVVHMALKERTDVATMGIGEGRYRQVLVVPEGAPEYDDAVESARDAN